MEVRQTELVVKHIQHYNSRTVHAPDAHRMDASAGTGTPLAGQAPNRSRTYVEREREYTTVHMGLCRETRLAAGGARLAGWATYDSRS